MDANKFNSVRNVKAHYTSQLCNIIIMFGAIIAVQPCKGQDISMRASSSSSRMMFHTITNNIKKRYS